MSETRNRGQGRQPVCCFGVCFRVRETSLRGARRACSSAACQSSADQPHRKLEAALRRCLEHRLHDALVLTLMHGAGGVDEALHVGEAQRMQQRGLLTITGRGQTEWWVEGP